MTIKHELLTKEIIGAFYAVYNDLRYGFLEKVYENALALELADRGLTVEQQKRIQVHYGGQIVGEYCADMLIEAKVILELKTAESISGAHVAQLTNYLRATTCEVGLVLNFGAKPEYKRRFFSNERKLKLRKNPRKSA